VVVRNRVSSERSRVPRRNAGVFTFNPQMHKQWQPPPWLMTKLQTSGPQANTFNNKDPGVGKVKNHWLDHTKDVILNSTCHLSILMLCVNGWLQAHLMCNVAMTHYQYSRSICKIKWAQQNTCNTPKKCTKSKKEKANSFNQ